MKILEKKRMSNSDAKKFENLVAENEKLKADLDFVAIMADIEIPTDDEEVVTDE